LANSIRPSEQTRMFPPSLSAGGYMQKRLTLSRAINDFNEVIRLNPKHVAALNRTVSCLRSITRVGPRRLRSGRSETGTPACSGIE
jgi:hypothetical protein